VKRIVRAPNTVIPTPADVDTSELPDFDVEKLLANSGAILAREIKNLMMASSRGKLEASDARDLVAYIKLLSELKEAQKAEMADMTEEQLAALVEKDSQS
jgi:hypothetical protein